MWCFAINIFPTSAWDILCFYAVSCLPEHEKSHAFDFCTLMATTRPTTVGPIFALHDRPNFAFLHQNMLVGNGWRVIKPLSSKHISCKIFCKNETGNRSMVLAHLFFRWDNQVHVLLLKSFNHHWIRQNYTHLQMLATTSTYILNLSHSSYMTDTVNSGHAWLLVVTW